MKPVVSLKGLSSIDGKAKKLLFTDRIENFGSMEPWDSAKSKKIQVAETFYNSNNPTAIKIASKSYWPVVIFVLLPIGIILGFLSAPLLLVFAVIALIWGLVNSMMTKK